MFISKIPKFAHLIQPKEDAGDSLSSEPSIDVKRKHTLVFDTDAPEFIPLHPIPEEEGAEKKRRKSGSKDEDSESEASDGSDTSSDLSDQPVFGEEEEENEELKPQIVLPTLSLGSLSETVTSNQLPIWATPSKFGARDVVNSEKRKAYFGMEILALSQWSTTASEVQVRDMMFQRIKSICEGFWPTATILLFGSVACDLALPSSDLDIVIQEAEVPSEEGGPASIDLLYWDLLQKPWASNVKCLKNAFVPIIKFDGDAGCPVDISFNRTNGPGNTEVVKKYLTQFPLLKPMVILIKAYLHSHNLNTTYIGGISSYAVVLMARYYLQEHTKQHKNQSDEITLAEVCLGFFHYFGSIFDYKTQYLYYPSAEEDPCIRTKTPEQMTGMDQLMIIDPHDESNVIGGGSFLISNVKEVLLMAYRDLSQDSQSPTYLSRILKLPKDTFLKRLSMTQYFRNHNKK